MPSTTRFVALLLALFAFPFLSIGVHADEGAKAYRECAPGCKAGEEGVMVDAKGNLLTQVTDPKELNLSQEKTEVALSAKAIADRQVELVKKMAERDKLGKSLIDKLKRRSLEKEIAKLNKEVATGKSKDFELKATLVDWWKGGGGSSNEALNNCLTVKSGTQFCQDKLKQLAADNPDLFEGDPNGPFTVMQRKDKSVQIVGGGTAVTQSQPAVVVQTQPSTPVSKDACVRYPDLCQDTNDSIQAAGGKDSGLLAKLGVKGLASWERAATTANNCLDGKGNLIANCTKSEFKRERLAFAAVRRQTAGGDGSSSAAGYETTDSYYKDAAFSTDAEIGPGREATGDGTLPQVRPPLKNDAPTTPEDILRKAQALLGEGRYDEATALLGMLGGGEELTEGQIRMASEAAVQAAFQANEQHDFAASESAARQALRLDPTNVAAYQELAWSQLYQKKPQDALDTANRAVARDPRNAFSLVLRALAYEQLGRRAEMLADLEAAAKLDAAYANHLAVARSGRRLFNPDNKASDALRKRIDMAYNVDDSDTSDGGAWEALRKRWGYLLFILVVACAVLAGVLRRRRVVGAIPVPGGAGSPRDAQRYAAQRELGRGAASSLWEAYDKVQECRVAVKRLSDPSLARGGAARAQFLREMNPVVALKHPDLLRLNEALDLPTGLFLVYEMIDALPLSRLLSQVSRLPAPVAVRILGRVCAGLDHAHARGIVHGNLKPTDILIRQNGDAMVMDLGLARAARRPLSLYSAPECLSGVPGPAADVFSLGLLLHRMVTGALPFGDVPAYSRGSGAVPRASIAAEGVPAELDSIIARALQPEVNVRTRSTREFMTALAVVPAAADVNSGS